MAALTTDRITDVLAQGFLPALPVAAAKIIYAGSIVANDGAGNMLPGADSVGLFVMGMAVSQVDNSGGAAGAKTISLASPVIGRFDAVETVRLNPGKILYVVDDHTVGDAPGTNSIKGGICLQKISSTEVWLLIDLAATHP